MATAQPAGQQRNAFGRDHGNFATVALMPNGSGNVLPTATVPFTVEAGDHCYLSLATGQSDYLCISAGAAAGGDAVWVPSSGQGPWSSVLYVDNVRGSDTTGQRGNANRPFATIQAAANAMLTDDFLQVAPQRFLTTAALTFPSTLVRGGMVGFSRGGWLTSTTAGLGAIIRCTGDHAINLGANLGLSRFYMADMQLFTPTAAKFGLFADGSAYAVATFLSSGLVVENCDIRGVGGGISTKYAVIQTYVSVQSLDACSFINFLTLSFLTCSMSTSTITISSDVGDPLTTQFQPSCTVGRGTALGGGSAAGVVNWGGQVFFNIDQSCTIGGLKGNGLSAHPAVPVANPGCRVAARIAGANAGVIDFQTAGSEIPDTATALTIDFRQTKFATDNNACSIRFKVAGAAVNFQTISLDGAVMTPSGATIIADAAIHLFARGASVPQGVWQTPGATGDVIPPSLEGTIDTNGLAAAAKTWVQLGYAGLIRTGAAPDTAFLTSVAQGCDAVIPARTTLGLTLTGNAVANLACWRADWK